MDLMQGLKKARELQAKMELVQQELAAIEVEGRAGGGLVSVTMSGRLTMTRVKIDPGSVKPGDAEMLEDLVLAAYQDARKKAEGVAQEKMKALTAGLPIPPGMKLF
jgi:hypothetical protein